jgi:hypothetical protein
MEPERKENNMIENTVTPEEHAKMAKEVIDRMESKEHTKVFTKAHSDELNAMLAADKAKGKGNETSEPAEEPKANPDAKPQREYVNVGAATAPIPEPQSAPQMDSNKRSEVFDAAHKAHKTVPVQQGPSRGEVFSTKVKHPVGSIEGSMRNSMGYDHTSEDIDALAAKGHLNHFYEYLDKDHEEGMHESTTLGSHPHCSACIVKAAAS